MPFLGLAGAAVGWGLLLAIGAGLAWRSSHRIRPQPRLVAGFAVAVLALLWAALASRQLMGVSHADLHLGLAASIRAGGFPPELPWSPGMLVRYHYGPDLLVGLLAPPVGLDLAFVTELFGAYGWTSFALVVTTALLRRASPIAVLVAAPLVLANGLWTWTSPAGGAILQGPIPAGLPGTGLPESLSNIYWPMVELAPNVRISDLLADISKPSYTLGYALTLVVLEHVARSQRWSWRASVTLASLVGFLGPACHHARAGGDGCVGWSGGVACHAIPACRLGGGRGAAVRRGSGAGGAAAARWRQRVHGDSGWCAAVRLEGWRGTSIQRALGGARHLRLLLPGGVGLLGAGPLAVAGVAVVLARRDRLVVALAAGAGLLVVAWLALAYPPAPWDVNRFAGHARNLALVALLLAMTARLADLQPTHRRCAAALVAILLTWPTLVAPVRSLGLAVGHGVQLANARWVQEELIDRGVMVPMRRFQMPPLSGRLADYIQNHTPVDARVLVSEEPSWSVSAVTGRPNNAGFAGLTYLIYHLGPEYLDASQYLEPAAIRRLGIKYVHATNAWVAALPQRAQTWLGDPRLFELLVRDGHERLYRVRRAFLSLDVPPHPASFEALRQAVPPSATVYLVVPPRDYDTLLVAAALAHVRLIGQLDPLFLHLLRPAVWHVDPLTDETPDLIVLPIDAGALDVPARSTDADLVAR